MNFHQLMQYSLQSIEGMAPPRYYLHRKPPLGSASSESNDGKPNNFQDELSNQLLNTISVSGGKQYILRGLASEGKTTEIRRLAYSIQQKLLSPRRGFSNKATVHLLSMQNYAGIGANISSVDDLWSLLMSCHQARNIARQRTTLDEFILLHEASAHRPILLIDTLDMLSYGRGDEDVHHVTQIWAELVKKMNAANMTVLWSVRPNEIDIDVWKDPLRLTLIDLPQLAWDESLGLVRRFVDEVCDQDGRKPSVDFQVFNALLLVQYPILAKYMKAANGRSDSLRGRLFHMLQKMYDEFSESKAFQNVHPLDWVMKKENANRSKDMVTFEAPTGNFVIDELYKLSRNEILGAMHNILHIPEEDLEEVWFNHIEVKLFDEIEDQSADFTNRLWLPETLEGAYGETSQIYEYLMMIGGEGDDAYGLFSAEGNRVSFQHQLFAEYAVYRAAWAEEKGNPHQTVARHIPSCRLRMRAYPPDNSVGPDSQVREFMKWFKPFFTINRDLQSLPDNAPQIINGSDAWTEARRYALAYKNHKDSKLNSDQVDELLLKASEDKRNILKDHEKSNEPLSINGPAGTGKSYIANPFIFAFVNRSRRSGDLNEGQKPMVKFVTLSKDLAAGFIRDHEDFMGDRELPIELVSQPVDELLMNLTNVVLGENYPQLKDFSKFILTENRFVFVLSNDYEFGKKFGTSSVQSLWHEFLDCILDEKGDEIGLNNYVNDEKIFDKSQLADREKREILYKTLQRLDLLNTNKMKTRRKIASEIIDTLCKALVFGTDLNEATGLMERLKPYRTDVLLVDEVQDLGSAVLKLCFILHKGHQGDVAILGDREQTLELHEFDWKREFEIIGTSLYDLAQSAASSNFGDLLGLEKWNHHSGGSDLSNSVKDRLKYFHEVHRNVPPIVNLMRWSFQNAAKTDEISDLFSIPEGGTASIITNAKRVDDYNRWQKQFLDDDVDLRTEGSFPWGVFYIGTVDGTPRKISLSDLIEVIELASYSEDPIEIILPDEHHRKLVAEELKNAPGKGIQQTVWDPVTIKGLENKTIIAVSPWSIHNERLKQFLTVPSTDTWAEMVSRVPPGRRKEFVKIVEQRRRHANVMLSRPKNTLFILTLEGNNKDGVSLTDTTEPNFKAILEDANAANIMAEIDTIEELKTFLAGPDFNERERDPKRHMELLEKLIEQSRGLDQIGIKSLQVHNIAQDLLNQDPTTYQLMFSKFLLIHKFSNDVVGLEEADEVLGMSYLTDLLFSKDYRSHDLTKYKNNRVTPLQKAYLPWQLSFYELSDSFVYSDDEQPKLMYSTEAYDQLVALFNAFIHEVSGFQDHEIYENFEVIRDFVFDDIFGGTIDISASSIWFERARKMNLRVMEMEHLLDKPSNQQNRIDKLLDMMALFKRNYYESLVKNSSSDEKDAKWTALLEKRGYDKKSSSRDRLNKLLPYKEKQITERPTSERLVEDHQQSAFWEEGLTFLEFNEFDEDQLRELEAKFFQSLAENQEPAQEHPWLDDQLRWLVKLLVHRLDQKATRQVLVRLHDLERYGMVKDLADQRFSLEQMISGDIAANLWKDLQLDGGRIDRAWSNMLRMNHFHLYSAVKHHSVKPITDQSSSDFIKVERFYQTAALLACLDHDREIHPNVLADLEEKIKLMSTFVSDPAFLDLLSLGVNSATIMRYFENPAQGLLGARLADIFDNLENDQKGNLIHHVLGIYIGAHESRRQDNSLRSLFYEGKSMGLLPQTSVEEYIRQYVGADRKRFGEIINTLYPIHSAEERGNLPYYPVHVNNSFMDTPTMLYDTNGLIRPEAVKDQRTSWLEESLIYAFEEELCGLNDVEDNAIYTLGLNEFARLVTYLPRAPTRHANFQEIWGSDLDVKQIHQQYVRYFLKEYINKDQKWLNSNYELIDNPNNKDNIRIFLGGLRGSCIQLELDRYLQIERFSRFLRAHISDLPAFSGRAMHSREVKAFDELFKVLSLIRHLVDAWVDGEGESAALKTIVHRFWENICVAVPPNVAVELPASIDELFNGCDCEFAYSKVLGNADEFVGFYGAARKLLTMFGGTTEAFGKTQIKSFDGGAVAPKSGTGEVSIGARVHPVLQNIALNQINALKWAAESNKPMAELNRLSKEGKITWYDGFTFTDLGPSPLDNVVPSEEE